MGRPDIESRRGPLTVSPTLTSNLKDSSIITFYTDILLLLCLYLDKTFKVKFTIIYLYIYFYNINVPLDRKGKDMNVDVYSWQTLRYHRKKGNLYTGFRRFIILVGYMDYLLSTRITDTNYIWIKRKSYTFL